MATPVACRWAGAVLEKVTKASGQELYAQKAQKRQKVTSHPRIAHGQRYPMPCLEWSAEEVE